MSMNDATSSLFFPSAKAGHDESVLHEDFFNLFHESGLAEAAQQLELTFPDPLLHNPRTHQSKQPGGELPNGEEELLNGDWSGQKRKSPETARNAPESNLIENISEIAPPGTIFIDGMHPMASRPTTEPSVPKASETKGAKRAAKPRSSSSTSSTAANAIAADKKGLRQFSFRVMKKVEEHQLTTYNAVADDLVAEYSNSSNEKGYDEKNIRRRVYDALNVLLAMDIIGKVRKEIRWKGFPANSERELERLRLEKEQRLECISQKQERLEDLVFQYVSIKNLLSRNEGSVERPDEAHQLRIPCVVISTAANSCINIDVQDDKQRATIDFKESFRLHDDVTVLQKMEMFKCSASDLPKLIPPPLADFITQRRPEILSSSTGLAVFGEEE